MEEIRSYRENYFHFAFRWPFRLSLIVAAFSFAEVRAAELVYIGRAGLFSDEFVASDRFYQDQSSGVYGIIGERYLLGGSQRYEGTSPLGMAAWVTEVTTAATTRIGLYEGAEFSSTSGWQYSKIDNVFGESYLWGRSTRYVNSVSAGEAMWSANAATGITSRIGLYSTDFTRASDGMQNGNVKLLTGSEYLGGYSSRYNGSANAGEAAWVANAATGVTHRVGLYSEPEFFRDDNFQHSSVVDLSESGFSIGHSIRFIAGVYSAGQAAWVADKNGITIRAGFYGGSEFRKLSGEEVSFVTKLNEDGYAIGYSNRYQGDDDAGRVAWVAGGVNVPTREIGLTGNAYVLDGNGYRYSEASYLSESGYVAGCSKRFYNGDDAGRAEWVGNASGGAVSRIGLYSDPEFTRSDSDYQFSQTTLFTESGFLVGTSKRFENGAHVGEAAWVASAVSGETHRIGLYPAPDAASAGVSFGSSFADKITESGFVIGRTERSGVMGDAGQATWTAKANTGETTRIGLFTGDEFTSHNSGYQNTVVRGMTESGFAFGYSKRFNADQDAGEATWLADLSTGVNHRIGLFSEAEFVRASDNYQSSSVEVAVEGGYVVGYSARYASSSSAGNAVWVANASTGETFRVGFYEGTEFTSSSNHFQASDIWGLTQSGFVIGSSAQFNGDAYIGSAMWVAASNGTTTQVGLSDSAHTDAEGGQRGYFTGMSEGYVYGLTTRYLGSSYGGVEGGQTAWLFDLNSQQQIVFDISVYSSGYSYSRIDGITDGGVAYGFYWLFDGEDVSDRAFIWSAELGVISLDESISEGVSQYGWSSFTDVKLVTEGGVIVGSGGITGSLGNGVYIVAVVPEGSTYVFMIIGSSAISWVARRKRTKLAA